MFVQVVKDSEAERVTVALGSWEEKPEGGEYLILPSTTRRADPCVSLWAIQLVHGNNKDNNENNNKNLNIVNLFPRLISFQSPFYVMDLVDYIGIYVSI